MENQPKPTPTEGASKPPVEPVKPVDAPKPRREWTNPALQAMGIKRIRIPSRNWSIFWAVTGTLLGGYFYDRRERKKARQAWKDRVHFLAEQDMSPLALPRKVTVFLAPPPADFLDLGLAHFRQYIKPILTAAAVDYEVKSETRQGEIRHMVAEQIRKTRREALDLPETEDKSSLSELEKQQEADIKRQLQSHLVRDDTGGIICVGRGAYKEYLMGIQEGWLGPLEPPAEPVIEASSNEIAAASGDVEVSTEITDSAVTDDGASQTSEILSKTDEIVGNSSETSDSEAQSVQSLDDNLRNAEEEDPENKPEPKEHEKKEEKPPVPKAYISCSEYSEAPLPAEFASAAKFEPVAAIAFPHLIGFLTIPTRIYRFFNQRYLADQLGEATAAVVLAHTRPFEKSDIEALAYEEEDWPSKWKKRALESNSEWMQDLVVSDKIAEHLQVYTEPEGGFAENTNSSEEPPSAS